MTLPPASAGVDSRAKLCQPAHAPVVCSVYSSHSDLEAPVVVLWRETQQGLFSYLGTKHPPLSHQVNKGLLRMSSSKAPER